MIAIVMAYKDRPYQLSKTLLSINGNPTVIVVDDDSEYPPILPRVNYPLHLITVKKGEWVNGIPAYNIGFKRAVELGSDKVIIQNPECYHVGDIVGESEKLKQGEYIAFGCFSIDKETTFSKHDILQVLNNVGASHDGQNAWYNHSIYRPVNYHFCSVINTSDLVKINGFDERLAYGIAYDDNLLLHQIRSLGLNIRTVDSPFVVHQWHYTSTIENKEYLVNKNLELYKELSSQPMIKAKHY